MTETAGIGHNEGPPVDALLTRLEQDYAEYGDRLGTIIADAFTLPTIIDSDDAAARLVNSVQQAKRVRKAAEDDRKTEKDEYLKAGRTVDGFFQGITGELDRHIVGLEAKISAYQRAKAEAERAERMERERKEREAALAAQRAAEEAAEAAAQAEREAQEAAVRIRAAESAEERRAAQEEMRQATEEAAALRQTAEDEQQTAVQSERTAESLARSTAPLGRVTAEGATVATTTFWNHRIVDADALTASLGWLGPHLSAVAIDVAVNAWKRQAVQAKTIKAETVNGVEFFEDSRSSVRENRTLR